jgi:hypothetical protein
MAVANTLAYYVTAKITAVKSFIEQANAQNTLSVPNQHILAIS